MRKPTCHDSALFSHMPASQGNDGMTAHVMLQGADDVFNLSVGKEFGEQTGKFYSGQGPMQVPDCAQAKALSQQLFQLMQEQIGAQFNC